MTNKVPRNSTELHFPPLQQPISHFISITLSYDDFLVSLNEMKNFTAPGENKIGTEIFQALPEIQKKQFFDFLQFCWNKNWSPPEWKKAKIKLIPKEQVPEYAT